MELRIFNFNDGFLRKKRFPGFKSFLLPLYFFYRKQSFWSTLKTLLLNSLRFDANSLASSCCLSAFWGLRLICAGRCHAEECHAARGNWLESAYERFREICHKPCDVSSQLLFLNVSSKVVNNDVIVYQNFCNFLLKWGMNLSTKKYVCKEREEIGGF